MSLESVASRYAQALFELGTETNTLATLVSEIRSFGDAYALSPELRAVLDNPLVDEKQRLAVLAELATRLGVSTMTKNTVSLLADRRRLSTLPLIARQLDQLSDEKAGIVRATVTSASALSDAYADKLRAELEKRTGKKVVLDRAVDPTLLGGVVTRIGDQIIDGSLKTRLATMRDSLLA